MSESGSYTLPASRRDAQTEIERLATQAASGWHKESRVLSSFGLTDGMSVLEAGSGPGFITEQLLTLIPNSALTCLDIDPNLLQQAEQYLQDKTMPRIQVQPVQFVQGSIVDTTFMDVNTDILVGEHAVAVSATLVTDDGAFSHRKEWIITENPVAKLNPRLLD